MKELNNISIKKALNNGRSFYKLIVKVKKELVAYNIPEESYNIQKTGKYLNAKEYNRALDNPETLVVDMRNYYESEVGRFKGAILPNVETSKELLPEVKETFKRGRKRRKYYFTVQVVLGAKKQVLI